VYVFYVVLYIAVKLGCDPVECRPLHEPIDGWVWVRCPNLGSLLRDVARSLLSGLKPLLVTPQGPLDPLEAEKHLSELEDPRLDGSFEVLVKEREPAELLKLGATSLTWKPGSPTIMASFKGASVVTLLERGLVPLVWKEQRRHNVHPRDGEFED
jgi:hypothetical protein